MVDLKKIINEAIDPSLNIIGIKPSKEASVMLLAIGLQESRFIDRRQLVGKPPEPTGPAKSFWQGERGGGMVHGVRIHEATRDKATLLYKARGLQPNNQAIWDAIENDDVLAAGLARLLLWSDPKALPKLGDVEGAWQLYLRTWRPGAYANGTPTKRAELREKWTGNYAKALVAVQ